MNDVMEKCSTEGVDERGPRNGLAREAGCVGDPSLRLEKTAPLGMTQEWAAVR
jgi:hypothetical protein